MTVIIGLHGAKGSGKDQFYKAVSEAFPELPIKKIAYADPIKNEVCRIFDLQNEQQYDLFKRTTVSYQLPGFAKHSVEGRDVVREIGMKMRWYDENQFVRYVEETIAQEPNTIWCITDLRFSNEFNSVRDLEGYVVKIKRGGIQYDGHATEIEFHDDSCDFHIHNVDLTLEEYNQLAVQTFSDILTKEGLL